VHELWCPPGTPALTLDRLVLARYPSAQVDGDRRVLTRHSTLAGPRLDARDELVWTARTPRERGDAPRPGQTDPHGLYRVFPDGMPDREERRVLGLLLGLARRTGGSLVVDVGTDQPRPLPVDPLGRLDLQVLSPVALDPHQVLAAARSQEPSARLAMDGADFVPDPMPDEHLPELLRRMSRHDRAEAAAFSEVHDRAALAGPDVLDAYAVDVPLGGLGTVVVEAHDEDDPPPLVRHRGWREVLSYDVRWVPVDPEQAETDTPDEAFRAARAAVRPRLGAVARAVAELAPGEVLDADGLPVNRYAL
jgi:hypothetical protein